MVLTITIDKSVFLENENIIASRKRQEDFFDHGLPAEYFLRQYSMSLEVAVIEGKWKFKIDKQVFSSLVKALCQPPMHQLSDPFFCPQTNCSIRPEICKNCAFKSIVNTGGEGTMICKLCSVTEMMADLNTETIKFEDGDKKISLIASVSYDRKKGQFKYSENLGEVFGEDKAKQMMSAQSGNQQLARAQNNFENARIGNQKNKNSQRMFKKPEPTSSQI